jgi:hypothetical protein
LRFAWVIVVGDNPKCEFWESWCSAPRLFLRWRKETEAKMTENDKPLREMDLAFLEMFDLLLDILVRMGVPKEEFDQQFKVTLQKVGKFPEAKFIIEKLAKVAAARASDLKDLERISLLHQRPKGSA